MDCSAFCTATAYRIKPLFEKLRTKYKTSLIREVLHLEIGAAENSEPADVFFFPYGSCVCWGLNKEQGHEILHLAREFEHQPSGYVETDEFTYVYGDASKVAEDEIILPNRDVLTKAALSHGIAQSVKLGQFEVAIQKTFDSSKDIPEDLAKHGRIGLSRREIRCKMGELFLERSSINLHVDVLDTPEFFWEYPELECHYQLMANYLDVSTRVEVLNQRLDVIHELFQMLGNELNHQHSSRLEITIIALIVIEVVLILAKDVFHVL